MRSRPPLVEYRPPADITREACEHMHRLGAAYSELGLYWLSTGSAPSELALLAYETSCLIHTLARAIGEAAVERESNT